MYLPKGLSLASNNITHAALIGFLGLKLITYKLKKQGLRLTYTYTLTTPWEHTSELQTCTHET